MRIYFSCHPASNSPLSKGSKDHAWENPNTRRREIEIISNVRLPEEDESPSNCGLWNEFGEGIALRFVYVGEPSKNIDSKS